MEIITRRQAIERRLPKYFTGEPCKNGHIAERYLVNSSCEHCIHPPDESLEAIARREERELVRQDKLRRKDEREARTEAKSRMVRKKFRVNDCDLEGFRLAVLCSCMMREPAIRMQDIQSKWMPMRCNPTKQIYAFMIFPQDEMDLRKLECAWEKLHDVHYAIHPTGPLPVVAERVLPEWNFS